MKINKGFATRHNPNRFFKQKCVFTFQKLDRNFLCILLDLKRAVVSKITFVTNFLTTITVILFSFASKNHHSMAVSNTDQK